MYFGLIPPETVSDEMYDGPGSTSMYDAAEDWQALADDLDTAATGFDGVFWALQRNWIGPAATRMTAAASPYAQWLWAASRHVNRTAEQTKLLAQAYDTAFDMTVPPDAIAWNQTRFEEASADNVLGLRSAEIADLEWEYQEYWIQDAEAMETYAATALAALSEVAPFAEAPQITNEAGLFWPAAV